MILYISCYAQQTVYKICYLTFDINSVYLMFSPHYIQHQKKVNAVLSRVYNVLGRVSNFAIRNEK